MAILGNFTSVFEVSAAIHLAYSLLREVHERPITTIEKQLDRIKKDFDDLKATKKGNNESEYVSMSSSLWVVDMGIILKLLPHQIMIRRFTYISIVIATLSISLLILSGFYPAFVVSQHIMILILVVLLLPMPILILVTKSIMKKDIKEVNKSLWLATRELSDLIEKGTAH